ncbi:MAG: dynamin family protein [Synergistaceae bacterium]|nr:dynamin family protein [Synergistaceae bacterium]
MDIDRHIHYDAAELIRNTEQALDSLKIFQYEPNYRELLGDNLISKINFWDKSIRTRKDDPFTIVVCGEFKRGKSSLINALLKEEVVTTNVTTETVTLNYISYGSRSNEAVLSGGRRMTISDDDMKRDKLESLIHTLGEPVTSLEIRRPNEMLKNVRIIDTPGLNDSQRNFSDMVEQAIHQADAVIYVCSADSPLSLSEQLFIKTVILPQKYTDIFIVANFADIISNENDFDRMQDFMNQKISSMLPSQKVLLLSALDEICRVSGNESPNASIKDKLTAEFDSFREDIAELLKIKKDTVLPDRIHRLTLGMLHDIDNEIAVLEDGLKLDAETALKHSEESKSKQQTQNAENAKYMERIKNEIFDMNLEAENWVNELLDKMRSDIATFGNITADDLKKYYSIFCVDTVQNAVNKCVDYHIEKLYDEFNSDVVKLFNRSEINYGFRFSLDNRTWTKGDNVGYIASKISQLSLLSLVVDGIAGAMREGEAAGKLPQIIEAITKQYPVFCESARESLEKIYEALNRDIQSQLTEYFKIQEQEILQRNEQILRAASQTEERKERTRTAINELKSALKNFNNQEVFS